MFANEVLFLKQKLVIHACGRLRGVACPPRGPGPRCRCVRERAVAREPPAWGSAAREEGRLEGEPAPDLGLLPRGQSWSLGRGPPV